MASVSIYLNFNGNAEEAFNHYKKAFGTEFSNPVMRMKDAPRGRRTTTICRKPRKTKSRTWPYPYWAAHKLWGPTYWKAWVINWSKETTLPSTWVPTPKKRPTDYTKHFRKVGQMA